MDRYTVYYRGKAYYDDSETDFNSIDYLNWNTAEEQFNYLQRMGCSDVYVRDNMYGCLFDGEWHE